LVFCCKLEKLSFISYKLDFYFLSTQNYKNIKYWKELQDVFVKKKEKKQMEISNINKTKLTATIAIVLLMTSTFMLMATPILAQEEYTNVQEGGSIPLPTGVTPDYEVATHAYMGVRPNPVGVDQTFLVNLWVTPATHVARYLSNYTVTIEKPSGTDVVKLDSYRGDATAWFEYIASEVGTWRLKFDFPGGYFPPGNYTVYPGAFVGPQENSFTESCYYQPSSTDWIELTVQEDQVLSWPPSPLPTDYWTRPVSPENREWWPILGNFPPTGVVGGGSNWPADTNIYMNDDYDYVPYTQAPNTSHVVWKRQDAIAGLIGGTMGQLSLTGRGNTPTIVYDGRCYDTYTKVVDGVTTNVWMCYDLRTGEEYWEKTDVSQIPTYLFYGTLARATVPGGGAYPGLVEAELMYIGQGRIIRYDPWDGHVTFNMSIAPLSGITSNAYYNTYPFFLTVQNLGGGEYRLINWTIAAEHVAMGYQYEFSLGVISNISWPWSNLGQSQDYESMIAFDASPITPPAVGAWDGTRVRAVDMLTGVELWDKEVPDSIFSSSTAVADHGMGACAMRDGYWMAWNLRTGNLAWKSEVVDLPWGIWWPYSVASAYGMIYDGCYAGVYAFNWTNGDIVWNYKDYSPPYETPYNGEYSFRGNNIIADGKVYTYNTEHTQTQPYTRGWSIHCIDAYTGEGIWKMVGEMVPGTIADGYLTAGSSYDGYLYVFGKGKSATTVTAPDTSVPRGTTLLIRGTVLDQSPAQPGTPCVSADSMDTQMNYLHVQRPIDGIWHNETITGVPVTVKAVDANGATTNIGTVTTNGYYGTFAIPWTPATEGTFDIIATFEGNDAYGSSSAATAVVIGPAPSEGQQQETEEPTTEAPTTEAPTTEAPTTEAPTTEVPTTEQPSGEAPAFPTTEVAIAAAVVVAVVVGVGAYWALRRRK
jgi:hypothetical protein